MKTGWSFKHPIFLGLCCVFYTVLPAQIYSGKTGKVSFTSKAPLEDIYAESNKLNAAINIKTKQVAAKVQIRTMEFENALQQEHFNEKYMESDKYPHAQFTGEVVEDVDLTEPGTYKVTVSGQLMIHGVGRERDIPVTLTVSETGIRAESSFKVAVADHKIEIPQLVFKKVAEVVTVDLDITMKKVKKKN